MHILDSCWISGRSLEDLDSIQERKLIRRHGVDFFWRRTWYCIGWETCMWRWLHQLWSTLWLASQLAQVSTRCTVPLRQSVWALLEFWTCLHEVAGFTRPLWSQNKISLQQAGYTHCYCQVNASKCSEHADLCRVDRQTHQWLSILTRLSTQIVLVTGQFRTLLKNQNSVKMFQGQSDALELQIEWGRPPS